MKKFFLLFLSLSCIASPIDALASDSSVNPIKISPKFCKHGLNQPDKGDFAVFVFCDDAMGTQIGIILTKAGVGPVVANNEWSNTNQFWQEGPRTTDVKEMVWSKSGNYLYVITSEVYSEEALYELDLRQRKSSILLEGKKVEAPLSIKKISDQTLVVNNKKFNIKN